MSSVTKKDLVDKIANRYPALKKNEILDVVEAFIAALGDVLVNGERVEIRDFGIFSTKIRKARVARNPKTGTPVNVPESRVASFKVGKELKERLANSSVVATSTPEVKDKSQPAVTNNPAGPSAS